MPWEWIVLAALTIIGPATFHRFLPTRQVVTVRGGGVFTLDYGPVAQIVRSVAKFGFVWLIALGLAQLESRLWMRLWIIGLPLIGVTGHFVYVRRCGVHWLSGRPLANPT